MTDHPRIWLMPICDKPECRGEERSWCQDNVWIEGCEDCGKAATEYRIAPDAGAAP